MKVLVLFLMFVGPGADAGERLQAMLDELRPHVELLEARDAPPTAEEMREAEPYLEALRAAIAAAEAEDPNAEALKEARRLLRRIRALDLVRKATELRVRVDMLGNQPDPPTDDEIRELRDLGTELQSTLVELEGESSKTQPTRKSVKAAESAVTLSRSADVMADANQGTVLLDSIESHPTDVSPAEASAVQLVAEQLQAGIDEVPRTGEQEPVGVTRARTILNRLLALMLADHTNHLLPEVEHLEALPDPPSRDELEALQPLIDRLVTVIDALERNLKAGNSGEAPPELMVGIKLLRRTADLRLARSLVELSPLVQTAEKQEDPLSPEQIAGLRKIPGELRPAMRTARRAPAKTTGEFTDSLEVTAAAALLQRVQSLVPDSKQVAEEPVDAPQTQPVTRNFRFYGSLRVRGLVTKDGGASLDGQTSRIGVRAQGNVFDKFNGFTRAELGFNFLDTPLLDLDEGRGLDDSFFFLRLAFVGAELGDNRSISFGKQWSSFYDVGVFSDQMPFFAGAGTGVYSAGSDGGLSGTGRADLALQYRDVLGIFKYSIQMQIRKKTDNDRFLADTLGGSLTWSMNDKMQLGAAYNEVRDGVPDPGENEPREGDRAFIVGYRYQAEDLYAGTTLTLFNNHDIDDQGVYFSGMGLEAYGSYQWSTKISLRAAISFLNPDSDYQGQYRVLAFTSGGTYTLTRKIRFVLLTRLDFSRLSDGSNRNGDTFSLSVFYNF